jgi:hypothetical protein
MKFQSLASTGAGDGEIFYKPIQGNDEPANQKEIISVVKFNTNRNIKDLLPQGFSIPDPPNYQTAVNRILVKCDENKYTIDKAEWWDASPQLVRVGVINPVDVKFSEFDKFSPIATLQAIVCQRKLSGIGINFVNDGDVVRISEVFGGSPAEKVGIEANDEIARINRQEIHGLAQEDVIERLRGPVGENVLLTILRKGRDKPLELTVTRGEFQIQPSRIGSTK